MAETALRNERKIIRERNDIHSEHGFHGAPMAKIADRAGVGAGTIYRYFENKDVMIVELYRDLEARKTTGSTVLVP